MKSNKKLISGWGGYSIQETDLFAPTSSDVLRSLIRRDGSFITRGLGRSYGDSAISSVVAQTNYLDHFITFDSKNGVLKAEAGLSLREILRIIVKQGWFIPVSPGTSWVTLGGAIASDIHGKNHHVAGTFGDHVVSMTMLLGNGEVVITSKEILPDLFHATCGGMGLTGVILDATITLIPIKSSNILQKTVKSKSLEQACIAFDENSDSTYSVAWIDCLKSGKNLGKSVLLLGEHSNSGDLSELNKKRVSVPIHAPDFLLNKTSIRVLNSTYYAHAFHNRARRVSLASFFYPLDAVEGWNKLYGKSGFIQYQFVLPILGGVHNMRKVLTEISNSGSGSFLAVLKKFGPANMNLLSFPMEGYTLALDFKATNTSISLIHRLDEMIAEIGGRVYLAKDALMTESIFKATYPKWQEFESVREKYGAIGKFASSQSKRLGLA
jgi:decaprenylphospho-beta-D-ribofuranose 2-oxidase